jgi:hypothetical protein
MMLLPGVLALAGWMAWAASGGLCWLGAAAFLPCISVLFLFATSC